MPQYRRISPVYDAVQYTGDGAQAESLVTAMFTNVQPEFEEISGSVPVEYEWSGRLLVESPDGQQIANPGDYILTNTDDNSRIVETEADFTANYEEVPA